MNINEKETARSGSREETPINNKFINLEVAGQKPKT
jgi:hypothetical protein